MRFAKWQIQSRLNPKPVIHSFTEKSKLILEKGMTGATGNLYCGLHDYNDMSFLLHFLRKGDSFVDIGANVGSYTVLASAHVGAQSISIEPVAATFEKLKNNLALNHIEEKVIAHNIALGSERGELGFTTTLDTMNHVTKDVSNTGAKVMVRTLDDVLNEWPVPALLKIDVEGFETEVLKGASKTLAQPELLAIIIELNGSGNSYGYDEKEIHENLIKLNFSPYTYDPVKRNLTLSKTYGELNTIYIRDINFVTDRLITAEKVRILNEEF